MMAYYIDRNSTLSAMLAKHKVPIKITDQEHRV
jgi:hypothetical protein